MKLDSNVFMTLTQLSVSSFVFFYECKCKAHSSELCGVFLMPEVCGIKVRLGRVHYHISQCVKGS